MDRMARYEDAMPTLSHSLLIIATCLACTGCGLSRASVESMRGEADPAKATEHLRTIAKALGEEQPQAPDLRCSLLDVGCELAAALPAGGGAEGEAVRAVALAEIAAPRLPAEPLAGLSEATARERLRVWAAFAVARSAPAEALSRLLPLLGDPAQGGGAGLPLQSAVLLAVLGSIDRIAADEALATTVREGGLRLDAMLAALPAGEAVGVRRQLDAVMDRLAAPEPLARSIADSAGDEARRIAAVHRAQRLLAGWVRAGGVPAAHRSALPRLTAALQALALGPDSPLRLAARDALVDQLPYVLLAQVPADPARQLEAVLLLPRLGAIAAHRPVGDLRLALGQAGAVIDPSIAMPGLDALEALHQLVDAVCADLTRFRGEDRWVVLEILATWAPGTLAEACAKTWQAGASDVATATDWLSALAIARRRNGAPAALAQISNVGASIVAARPPNGDPQPLWHLLSSIADGHDAEQIRAFSAVLAGEHRLPEETAANAVRFLVAAMGRAAAAPPPSWADGIVALRNVATLAPPAPIRVAAPFLLAYAPDELIAGLVARAAVTGLDDLEAVLLVDAALRAAKTSPAARASGLGWLSSVCTGCSDGDVRHGAARSIVELAAAAPAERALVAVAIKACPVLATLIPAAR